MPRVDLVDAFGTTFTVATTDLELLERWFREWLPRLFPPEMPEEHGYPRVAVWPLAGDDPSWPCDSRVLGRLHKFTRDPGDSLLVLEDLRKHLEQQTRQLQEAAPHGG